MNKRYYLHLRLLRQIPLQHLEPDEQRDLFAKHEGFTGVGAGSVGVSTGARAGGVPAGVRAGGGVPAGVGAGGGVSTGVGAGGGGINEAIWFLMRWALVP